MHVAQKCVAVWDIDMHKNKKFNAHQMSPFKT
jgi:hypothetical protein